GDDYYPLRITFYVLRITHHASLPHRLGRHDDAVGVSDVGPATDQGDALVGGRVHVVSVGQADAVRHTFFGQQVHGSDGVLVSHVVAGVDRDPVAGAQVFQVAEDFAVQVIVPGEDAVALLPRQGRAV